MKSNKIWNRMVQGKLSYEELEKLKKVDCPKGSYYDYKSIKEMLFKALNNKVSSEYLSLWIMLMQEALEKDDKKYDGLVKCLDMYSCSKVLWKREIATLIKKLEDYEYRYLHEDFVLCHRKEKLKVCYVFNNYYRKADYYVQLFVDYGINEYEIKIFPYKKFKFLRHWHYCFLNSDEDDDVDCNGFPVPNIEFEIIKRMGEIIYDTKSPCILKRIVMV